MNLTELPYDGILLCRTENIHQQDRQLPNVCFGVCGVALSVTFRDTHFEVPLPHFCRNRLELRSGRSDAFLLERMARPLLFDSSLHSSNRSDFVLTIVWNPLVKNLPTTGTD
jgi:hypothetical protein